MFSLESWAGELIKTDRTTGLSTCTEVKETKQVPPATQGERSQGNQSWWHPDPGSQLSRMGRCVFLTIVENIQSVRVCLHSTVWAGTCTTHPGTIRVKPPVPLALFTRSGQFGALLPFFHSEPPYFKWPIMHTQWEGGQELLQGTFLIVPVPRDTFWRLLMLFSLFWLRRSIPMKGIPRSHRAHQS